MDLDDLEYEVYQQARKLAIALTLHAEATGDWGASGSDFGRQSVARWLCQIPAHIPCYPEQTPYLTKLTEAAHDYGFPWVPKALGETSAPDAIATLEAFIGSFTFQLEDRQFSLQEGEELDQFLSKKGSNLIIISGYHGAELNLILGRGTRDYKHPYTHIALASEYLRSPSIVMPIVAMIGVHSVIVREVAVETVFHDKWMILSRTFWGMSPAEKLGFAIKKHTLEAYGITGLSQQDIAPIYPAFLSDMQCLLTAHEVGHGIIQHDRLPENTALMAESSQLLGDNILIALLELLADIAPESPYGKGPIWEIIAFASHSPQRAERCFGLYFSDAYFYDTNTPHMYSYAHLILPVMAQLRPLQKGIPTWLATDIAMAKLQAMADWAMTWVVHLSTALMDILAVDIPESEFTDPLKRYIQKGTKFYEILNLTLQKNPILRETATDYLSRQAPLVYRSLYDILGYHEIDERDPTEGVIKTVSPLFL